MHALTLSRDFVAQHYLIGGDWGEENDPHSHHYKVDVTLEGDALDRHGYLVDIVDLDRHLDELVRRYRDQMLNDLPELEGVNPSVERFARCFWQGLASALDAPNLDSLTVRMWENERASASFRGPLGEEVSPPWETGSESGG
jgi:6-pyruvoyltetrahydropterin/6-carboxytetrahydropterin synthase